MSTSRSRVPPGDPRSGARKKNSYHHGDLRRALLREAHRALDADGPASLSLRDVARRAGVSQAAPYRYFDGKEGLLAALAQAGFEQLGQTCRKAAVRHREPLAAFYAGCEAYVQFAVRNPQVYRLMFGSVRKRRDPAVAAAGGAAFAVLVDSVRTCQRAGVMRGEDPGPVAGTTTALCHGIASLFLDERTPDGLTVTAYARASLASLVEGLRRAD